MSGLPIYARDVALPPLEQSREPSGLRLVAVERRGVPLFHARLSLGAGASRDPEGKAGLASFAADLLRRGSRRRDAAGIDDLVEGMGAHLGADTTADETAISLTVPFDLAEAALDALLEVALEPSFPADELERAKRRTLAGLQADLDEPSVVAGRALLSLAYGPGHPYGHSAVGRVREVETFTRDECAAFHAASYQPGDALLSICGGARPEVLLDLARRSLAKVEWPRADGDQRPAPAIGPASSGADPGIPLRALILHKPDSTQAQVRLCSPGLSRRDPGWAAAFLANTALGGGFTSLLVDAIRVDRGLSYSVSSRLSMNRFAGLATFSSFTKNETLRELVDVALEKMQGYAQTGPTAEALDKSRRYLAGLYPYALEGHESLAEQVADALLDGVGLERLSTYRSSIASATADEVRQAAARTSPVRPGALLVVVGDAPAAERALSGLCPIEVVPLERFV